ncbi:unnamed protein product [Closterium sp. Naga37s-1]|nr:unnamed protein product [Closterium sp. Naga37s-1]
MSRRGFTPVALSPAAGLVALLLVAAAAGGVRGSSGNAALPRKLAAGGSGNSNAAADPAAAELVKNSAHASGAEGDGLVVKDSAPSASGEAEAEAQIPPLQLIIAEEGRAEGAVCLDGSAPGFYYRKGYGLGRNNWVLFFEGGAWCATPHGYAYRAHTRLGSTDRALSVAEMVDVQSGSMNGMLSSNKTVNPGFYNWNAVYFIYCDGGSFSGHQDEPVLFNGIPLYVRGRRVADLLLKHLVEKKGLGHAEKVVVSGSSAGGVAALLLCDRARDTLTAASPSMHVRCLADASMFLDVPDVNNTRRVANFFAEVHDMHVSKFGHAYYRKAVASAAAPLLHTDPPSSTTSSPSQPHSTPANAVFLFSCFQHGSIHSDMPWTVRTAKGVVS